MSALAVLSSAGVTVAASYDDRPTVRDPAHTIDRCGRSQRAATRPSRLSSAATGDPHATGGEFPTDMEPSIVAADVECSRT